MSKEKAEYLIKRDYLEQDDELGQRTSDTFHRADIFVRQDDTDELQRFLDLLFGCNSETPKQDEQAMFIAYAAAIRSGSLSRQVGAAIVNARGDLIAVGTNDVPEIGGGLFWPKKGKKDLRDLNKNRDPSDAYKDLLIENVVGRLMKKHDLERGRGKEQSDLNDKKEEIIEILRDSEIQDLTEFQRAVHAEMEALLACARSGANPSGGTLYTTLFPCHICSKHIIAAGIKRVIYIEPYPKSRTMELLDDFITLDSGEKENDEKICFEPFVGIGPRRYVDLFSLVWGTGVPLRRKDGRGFRIKWNSNKARVRLPMLPISYMEREAEAVKEIARIAEKNKLKTNL
jgi:deoxycytidylate deaminase